MLHNSPAGTNGENRGYTYNVGMWLSLVEHVLREHGVGGSNPLIPTSNSKGFRLISETLFSLFFSNI